MLAVVIDTPKQIQHRAVVLDGVKSQAAAQYEPEVQILEFVVFIIVEHIRQKTRTYVSSVTPAPTNGLSRRRWFSIHSCRSVDFVHIQLDGAGAGGSRGIERRGERGGSSVSAC